MRPVAATLRILYFLKLGMYTAATEPLNEDTNNSEVDS